jgi:hypothetical protein
MANVRLRDDECMILNGLNNKRFGTELAINNEQGNKNIESLKN